MLLKSPGMGPELIGFMLGSITVSLLPGSMAVAIAKVAVEKIKHYSVDVCLCLFVNVVSSVRVASRLLYCFESRPARG